MTDGASWTKLMEDIKAGRVGPNASDEIELPPPAERRELRLRAGVTWAQIEAATGFAPASVDRWERMDGPRNRTQRTRYAAFLRDLREALEFRDRAAGD